MVERSCVNPIRRVWEYNYLGVLLLIIRALVERLVLLNVLKLMLLVFFKRYKPFPHYNLNLWYTNAIWMTLFYYLNTRAM